MSNKRPQLRNRQKMKVLNKGVLVVAGTSILGLMLYLTVFVNTTNVSTSKANKMSNMMACYDLNNGDVISQFDFNSDNPLQATAGPDAISIGKDAHVTDDGVDQTKGLSAGKSKNDIRMEIPADNHFNCDGIDISLDFKRTEESANFYSRGKYFNFGMKKGKIVITYRINLEKGNASTISETTMYEVPVDDEFRNYRFIYNPNTGKGEIFVNGIAIWNHQGPKEKSLYWKAWDNIIIGDEMNGDGYDRTILDNVIVKSTSHVSTMPVTLLAFQARAEADHVMISWFTATETDIDSFAVERSEDAVVFAEIGRVRASGNSEKLVAYALADRSPLENKIAYYRLVPTNKPVKSITIPLIGYRYRKDHIENKDAKVVSAEANK